MPSTLSKQEFVDHVQLVGEQHGGAPLRLNALARAHHGRAEDLGPGLVLESLKGEVLARFSVSVSPDLLALMQVHMFRLTGGICTPRRNKQRAAKVRRHLERREPPRLPPVPRVFPQVTEPFYLYELGLRHDPLMITPPRGELPPIIRTR